MEMFALITVWWIWTNDIQSWNHPSITSAFFPHITGDFFFNKLDTSSYILWQNNPYGQWQHLITLVITIILKNEYPISFTNISGPEVAVQIIVMSYNLNEIVCWYVQRQKTIFLFYSMWLALSHLTYHLMAGVKCLTLRISETALWVWRRRQSLDKSDWAYTSGSTHFKLLRCCSSDTDHFKMGSSV